MVLQRRGQRIFLSQAGPRFFLELRHAEHHLLFADCRSPLRNDEGDPVGRPRWSCYAARDLADAPLHEGLDMAEAIAVRGLARPRRDGHDRRRFGKDGVGEFRHLHVQASDRRRTIAHRSDERKGFLERCAAPSARLVTKLRKECPHSVSAVRRSQRPDLPVHAEADSALAERDLRG
jgi:hypothetical protein